MKKVTLRVKDEALVEEMASLARQHGRSFNRECAEAFKLWRTICSAASSGYGRSLVLETVQRSGYTRAEVEALWNRHFGGEGKGDESD